MSIDHRHGGKREGAGRKPSPRPIERKHIGLYADQWEWLKGDYSVALRRLIDLMREEGHDPNERETQ